MTGVQLIQLLAEEYVSISQQLAYHVAKKNTPQIAKYEREQHEAAMKLMVTVAGYHGLTVQDFADAVERANNG